MAISESEYASIGRFVTSIASAESVTAKLWFDQSFKTGIALSTTYVQRRPMSDKLLELRKLVPRDGSRLDQQVAGLAAGYERISRARHAFVHGFLNEGGFSPHATNLRDESRVWIRELPELLRWAAYLDRASIQAYQDATRGMYEAEEHPPAFQPIIPPPESSQSHP